MEIRPINANDLEQFAYCTEPATWDNPYGGDYVVKMEDVDNLPTLDYAPVKHGRWGNIRFITTGDGRVKVGDCSVCKSMERARKFCPECGCKMDLEVTNGFDQH